MNRTHEARSLRSIRYVAEPTHVREVSLLGRANLAFWRERLSAEHLIPAEGDGHAQVLIIAATMRFMGIRFTEITFSVLLAGDAPGQVSAYMVQAFNSCQMFVHCERLLFATPYEHGDCRVSVSLPVSMQLIRKGEIVFNAAMHADSAKSQRQPLRSGDEKWEGRVFLPKRRAGNGEARGFFFGKLNGFTRTYAFLKATDAVTMRPPSATGIFHALRDSQFVAEERIVRENGTHGRSKTYRRSE